MSKNKKKKEILLRGEGIHQHALVGTFVLVGEDTPEVLVKEECDLVHEKPNGEFGEHNTLKVEAGDWQMGKQVEFNPFTQTTTRVWD